MKFLSLLILNSKIIFFLYIDFDALFILFLLSFCLFVMNENHDTLFLFIQISE